ncbi:MAG: bifunctional glutamate N-acetyltransferase/amino-acid acetyltransferase ArgJ [Anaerolineaceae bacterium]|nr:MAG: bifunctional glutamate N-acetyltransferase/amino-acid acetyltransferase ArgJ [Anaerolineaceae bacterium]
MVHHQAAEHIAGVSGFQVAGVHCGLKASGALDFALIVSSRPCVAAGVFTTNVVKAAPVLIGEARLKGGADGVRAVVVNTGSANAVTGEAGLRDAEQTLEWAAAALCIAPEDVLPLSTGVIGLPLPMERIKRGVEMAAASPAEDWTAAAQAITTTDTRPKTAFRRVQTPEGVFTVAGIAKGAGMIAPNMATMLAVIVTDATLTPADADSALRDATATTFNRIVVDGDMSTNDTVLLLANGASGVTVSARSAPFAGALESVCRSLAHQIVSDGEGVTKFITVSVCGATTQADAVQIAHTIATSALVKTAFYGEDANWGRILAAAGRAGVSFDPACVSLHIAEGVEQSGGLALLLDGAPTGYAEESAQAIMRADAITLTLDLGAGAESALVWTTDFSHDYVSINADYRS